MPHTPSRSDQPSVNQNSGIVTSHTIMHHGHSDPYSKTLRQAKKWTSRNPPSTNRPYTRQYQRRSPPGAASALTPAYTGPPKSTMPMIELLKPRRLPPGESRFGPHVTMGLIAHEMSGVASVSCPMYSR